MTFEGWYTDSSLTKEWDFQLYSPTGNMTLYAKWGYVNYATYEYSSELDGYVVTGVDPSAKIISISSRYNDGIHGDLRVVKMNKGCFASATSIEKLIIPFVGESESSNQRLNYLFNVEYDEYGESTTLDHMSTTLKIVELTNGLTAVPNEAFIDCTNIESIILPETCIGINDRAFKNCSSLTTISNYDNVKSIGFDAFRGSKIASFILTKNLETIKSGAFGGCTNLSTITFDENTKLRKLPYWLFEGCTSLTKVTIPNCIEEFESEVFYGCDNLVELSIPFVGNKAITEVNANEYVEAKSLSYLYDWSTRSNRNLHEYLVDMDAAMEEPVSTSTDLVNYGIFYADYYATSGLVFPSLKKLTITGSQTYLPIGAITGFVNLEEIYLPNITKIQTYGIYSTESEPYVYVKNGCVIEEWAISQGEPGKVRYF